MISFSAYRIYMTRAAAAAEQRQQQSSGSSQCDSRVGDWLCCSDLVALVFAVIVGGGCDDMPSAPQSFPTCY